MWLRAGLLHPAVFVGPWAIARLGGVDWAYKVIPPAAPASIVATIAMMADDAIDQGTRGRVNGLGLLAGCFAVALGFIV